MCSPGAEVGMAHSDPVALAHCRDTRRNIDDFETSLVAADGGGLGCAQQRCEFGLGGVDALDLVYVCWVDGGGEGAEEDGIFWEGGGDGVVVEAVYQVSFNSLGVESLIEGNGGGKGVYSRKHILWLAILAIHQRLGLCISIWSGLVAALHKLCYTRCSPCASESSS